MKFPDWDLGRVPLDLGPGWVPGCRQGPAYAGEETLLAGLLRSVEAGSQPFRQRLRDWSTTDPSLWAGLHAESPFWRGDSRPPAGAPGLLLDGAALPLPVPCSSHRFWGENAGPRLLADGGMLYARTLGSRAAVSGDVTDGCWFRRGPVAGFPYHGAWLQPWFLGDTGQVAPGDSYELSSPVGEPAAVSVSGGALWPSASLARFDPADRPADARGCPSRSLVPLDPLPRNPSEAHAARLSRLLSVTALADSPLPLRLAGAFGRVSMSASDVSGVPVRVPAFVLGTADFFLAGVTGLAGLFVTPRPLEARTPGTVFGGGGGAPTSRRSPFAYAGRPCASDRTLRAVPCDGLTPDPSAPLAPAVSADAPVTVTSARAPRDPAVLYATVGEAVSVLTPEDSVLRGGTLRVPGGGCRPFGALDARRPRWGDSAYAGGVSPLSGAGARTPSDAPSSGTPAPCFV